MKIHLGCGSKILPGWINCDVQAHPGVDIVAPFDQLEFEDGLVSEIYLCHLLEHFGRHEVSGILSRLFGWLKIGGRLWVAVPDFAACAEHYLEFRNVEVLLGLLMGGQKDPYDYHKMVFDYQFLAKELKAVGFGSIQRYDRDTHDVGKLGVDDFSAAYLPHMDPKGRLMSLNVVAVK